MSTRRRWLSVYQDEPSESPGEGEGNTFPDEETGVPPLEPQEPVA